MVGDNPVNSWDLLGLKTQRCSKINYFPALEIGLGDGWQASIRISSCDYCCGRDGGSLTKNYGKKKKLYTGDIKVSYEGEVSFRDKLMTKMKYTLPILAIVKAIEENSSQKLGDFGLRAEGEATFRINWDPCRESFTGKKSVPFIIKGTAFGDNNVGSAGSGWLAKANAAGGGVIDGRIFVEGRSVYIEAKGGIEGSASYNLIWGNFGNTRAGKMSGSVSGSLEMANIGKRRLWRVPQF